MKQRTLVRLASMVVVPVLVVAIGPPKAVAQREATRSDRIAVAVRRSGEPDGVQWPDLNIDPPPSLTAAQLSELFATGAAAFAVVQGPWKLSTTAMTAAGGRLRIAFREAQNVSAYIALIYGRPSVTYGQNTPGVLLSLRALAAGERYSVDCRVAPSAGSFRVSAPGSSGTFTGLGHVLASYTAVDTNPAILKIERMDSADPWGFFGCDISRTQ